MTNPLLQPHLLPPFTQIQAEHIVPAIMALIEESKQSLKQQLESFAISSWSELVEPIEAREDKIGQAWAPISQLNSVANSEELRQAYESADKMLTDYYSELGQNEALYSAYVGLAESDGFVAFSQQQKQAIGNAIRDFRLSGVALTGEDKQKFKNIRAELSSLTTKFSNNVLDATAGWCCEIDDERELHGLPDFIVSGARRAAELKQRPGYVLSLDLPVYFTVMTQAENAGLRQRMYEAYCTRASQYGPTAGQWDNTKLIPEILCLRQELAQLLGFANYAELSIAPKMAQSPKHVIDFLEELAKKSKPFAERELQELKVFAKETFALDELNAWDIPYFAEQLKLKKYSISQEILRPYFPLEVVKQGLFEVAQRLYGIDVRLASADVWHDDVCYYEVFRGSTKIASFYVDLYARKGKRGGAWMAECRTRRHNDGALQLPATFLVCNFNAPIDGAPCLLSHNEVTTLFHEFGHGLHHMLTTMEVAAVSGLSGVAWDAVELPSQFMENFCWQTETLGFLSQHFETGQSLPPELLNNMLAAKNFQSALQTLRQVEFALLDIKLHMEFGKPNFAGVQETIDKVREQVSVIVPPDYNRFQNGFTHIFAGGYAAGYYSYKWAEVLSADAFSAFLDEGIFNPATGLRFMREILEKGGSEDAMTLFKKFRGREPNPEALLRDTGLIER
ncbi:MAG: oligopeptidase A [Lentisphaeria bacterium]|jgi:oligopeptidase A